MSRPLFVDQPPSEMDGVFRRPSRSEVSSRRVQRPGKMYSAVAGQVVGQSGLSTLRWREHFFVRGAIRRSTCSRLASTRSCPCIARLSRIHRPSSRMQFRHPWDVPGPLRVPSLCSGRSGDRSRPAGHRESAMTLVAPLWPREVVVRRLAASTDPTTPGSSLLGQAASAVHCNLFHQGAHALNLHAWRLSSDTTESRAFRKGCSSLVRGPQRIFLSLVPVEMEDLCGWCRGRSVAPVYASVL